ncbi:MAG: amidase family protein [Actinomycetia bacterium]|nr:amidase family protein [Actinomycetes bacterium]
MPATAMVPNAAAAPLTLTQQSLSAVSVSTPPGAATGDPFNIVVETADATDLYAFDVEIAFDPEALGVAAGPAGSGLDLEGGYGGIVTDEGSVTAFHTRLGTSPGLSGPHTLADVAFVGLAPGTTSLRVTVTAVDADGESTVVSADENVLVDITESTETGSLTIESSQGSSIAAGSLGSVDLGSASNAGAGSLPGFSPVVTGREAFVDEGTPGALTSPFLVPYYTEHDLTGDREVTTADLAVVAPALGLSAGEDGWVAEADIDSDGEITIADLAEVSSRIIYDDGPFELVEADVVTLQAAMNADVTSAVDLVVDYTERIEALDKTVVQPGGRPLNSMITTNPTALAAAAEADAERDSTGMTSIVLGLPVVVKDNFNTVDMPTTAGCSCWDENQTDSDATMVSGLRDDGAVILGKSSLDEFAFGFVSQYSSFQEPGSVSFVASPYLTGETAGGSSGGTGAAIAANLAAFGLGTDTGGSIRVPSSYNQLVGIRPTMGLASREGIVPLALSQDTGGPMARSVLDAASALDTATGIDSEDALTERQNGHVPESYTSFLDTGSLDGATIGVVQSMVGTNAATNRMFDDARAYLESQGATVKVVTPPTEWNSDLPNGFASVLAEPSGSTNEFRHDLDDYIEKHLAPEVELRSLLTIAESGQLVPSRAGTYRSRGAISEETYEEWAGPDGTHTRALAEGKRLVHALMDDEGLDALLYPSGNPYSTQGTNMRLSPNTGMPAVTVPMGQVVEADGSRHVGAGVNLELLGRDFSEGTLLGLAYGLEQGLSARQTPTDYGPIG